MQMRHAWWGILALTLAVYAVMLGWTLPAISRAADGLAPFDMRPGGYGPEEARAFLSALSDEGRALYAGPQRWLDIFYPPLLALSLAGAIWQLYRGRIWRALFLAAILGGMGADWLENIRVAGLLNGVPEDADIVAASRASVMKSSLTSVAMLGVLFGLLRAGARRLVRARRAGGSGQE
ncbi:hypothetical protein R3X27_08245 [Tropicimonas sp. TH_r6]|uniref:hypothetical protein n=1 Tax=Tropicimonas sp. TH_r6 TaxID=3082085 RepID=UPI002954C997|nr:hypothetical protein [Tropicimonas sp. TH_r6]MDV7142670.1 hypothetical protein [Tropicimonas sp. TH_r6]